MNQTEKHSTWLIVGLFMLGVCMRMPITAIPSIVKEIAANLHVPANSLGILTTIPLICFAWLSTPVSTVARKMGNELTLFMGMIIMVVGSLLRIFNFTSLIWGTILVGVAITCINVLLPAVITEKYPSRIGSVTGMYNVSMSLFAAIGAYAITPITAASSWQMAIMVITIVALITLLIWLPNLRFNSKEAETTEGMAKPINMWTKLNAWWLLLFFGFQSLVFYAVVAWLPSIAMDAGLSHNNASLIAGLFQLFSIPFAFLTPLLASRMHNRLPLFLLAGLSPLIGSAMMLVHTSSLAYYIIVSLLLGVGCSTAFALSMTLFSLKTRTAADTRSISGMVQTVGYLIAATGPMIVGQLNAVTHAWDTGIIAIIISCVAVVLFGWLSDREEYI